jgi:exosome complex component RRP45
MQHPTSEVIANSEREFIVRALEKGVRVDGRRLLQARALSVAFGADLGSVEVALGETRVLAAVTAELVEPYPDRAAEGALQVFVDFSPMASPLFEPGRPSDDAVELMRLLERALRRSQAVDVEALCVVAGRRVWSVRCDVTVLDHRGNLADACLAAALAALRTYQLPAVAVTGAGDEATVRVLPAEQAERQPLVFHHTPVGVTVGFFVGPSGGAPVAAFDPTDREEIVMAAALSVVLNQHGEVCALHKSGGLAVAPTLLLEMVQHAAAAAPELLAALDAALAAHADRLAADAVVLAKTGRAARPGRTAAAEAPPLAVGSGGPDAAVESGAETAAAPAPAAAPAAAPAVAPAAAFGGGSQSAWDEEPAAAMDADAFKGSDDEDETTTLAPAPAAQPSPGAKKKRRKKRDS